MRIGIDARMYGGGYGLGRYIEQFLFHLEAADATNEYVIFVLPEFADRLQFQSDKITMKSLDIPWYGWREQLFFKKHIRKAQVDLMYFPHWNIPLMYRDPFIVTIHDLTMYHFPRPEATTKGPIVHWFKDKAHRLVVRHAVKRSKTIIAPTQFTKQDIMQTLGVPAGKIHVVNEGVDITISEKDGDWEQLKQLHTIEKPYVLYVGSAYPHKNVAGLLASWEIMQQQYAEDIELLLVGKRTPFWERLLPAIEKQSNVRYLGFQDDAALMQLYAHASLFVFPSLYEGFGLPPLEAMSHGVPVVSSNRSCLPEVLGEGALYADPEDHAQFAATMLTGLRDGAVRNQLKERAQKEVARYAWGDMAKKIVGFFSTNA